MTDARIEAIEALLEETGNAHGVYEETELNGVYHDEWAEWYAAYAVEHGLPGLLGRPVNAEELARFLADSNTEFERASPKPNASWAAYTARRISAEL